MIELINRNIIQPIYFLINKDNRFQELSTLEKLQWVDKQTIIEQQFKDFQKLIFYAYKNVPFYKNKFLNIGLHPNDVRTIEDIKRIPVLTKNDLQRYFSQLTAYGWPNHKKYQDASGGSTGKPTIFLGDRTALPRKFAAALMTDKWTGWNIGAKVAYLWGADRDHNLLRSFRSKLIHKYIFRQSNLNAFGLNEEMMSNFAKTLTIEKPQLMIGYTNLMFLFAQFCIQNGIKTIKPKGIVCSAETLSETKRTIIQEAFSCIVLNRYGSREVGLIGSECPKQEGIHINSSELLVELLPFKSTSADTNQYEIIVTDLRNYAMPFIRYRMEDIADADFGTCSCGRGLPVIGSVTGRTSDFIRHPNGQVIHGEFFSHLFYGIKGIRQFQVIQKDIGSLMVTIVQDGCIEDHDLNTIYKKLQEEMSEAVWIDLKIKDNIDFPPSGKFRFAISEIEW